MKWEPLYCAIYGGIVFNVGLFIGAATGSFYGWTP